MQMTKMNKNILRILELCMKLNPTSTKRSETGKKPTVFFNFSGHVNVIEIEICEDGWSNDNSNKYLTYNISIYRQECIQTHSDDRSHERECTIGEIITLLEKLCEDWP